MAVHRCPQCSAPMRVDFVGTMSDKVMRCDYCKTVVDVPDTSTVAESTTTRAIGPGGLTVTTTRKKVLSRSDGVSDAGGAGDGKVVELDMGDKKAALGQLHELVRKHIPNGAEIDLADLEAFVNDASEPTAGTPGDEVHRVVEIVRDSRSLHLDVPGVLGLSVGLGSADHSPDRRGISVRATSAGQISCANHGGSTSSAARRGPQAGGVRVPLWLILVAATLALIIAIVVLA